MAGMLQIITYLLCVYLVFKGVEILQIALMSNREDRRAGIAIGILCVCICIGAARHFVGMIDAQAESMQGRTSSSYPTP